MLKKNTGITLIALVITVVVLLILAGVSISLVVGNNGVLTQASNAVVKNREAKAKEEVTMAWASAETEYWKEWAKDSSKNRASFFTAENLSKYTVATGTVTESTANANGSYTVKYQANDQGTIFTFTVDADGNVMAVVGSEAGGTTLNYPTIAVGETAIGGKKTYSDGSATAIIPQGWTVSGITGETTISSGLVIYDLRDASGNAVDTSSWDSDYWNENIETIQETYNQFVWVPVTDSSKFTRNDWKNWNGTDEPTAYTTTSLANDQYSESADVDPTGKYTEMYNSVTSNHGFYIARYEAGTTATSGTGIRGTIVSKKNANVYNDIKWNGTTSSDSTETQMTTTTGGVVEAAIGMNTPNVTSTLCYGVQWDAVLRWISEDSSLKQYVTNSTGKGNYSDVSSTYGSSGKTGIFEMKNIYDMAGNVYEYTMEAYTTTQRVHRGGDSGSTGGEDPVSVRTSSSPNHSNAFIGFRVSLYL